MMQSAGITNTKSGTWLRSFFQNAVPHVGDHLTKWDKTKNDFLEQMGLIDSTHTKALWEVMGEDGKVDWDKSILTLSGIMSKFMATTPAFKRMDMIHRTS